MMSIDCEPTRRMMLRTLALGTLAVATPALAATPLPMVVVNKDPNCGCCQKWADHLRAAGFPVDVVVRTDMPAVKAAYGVPDDLASCHTATLAGYVVEGHVPAHALLRLVEERPDAIGVSAPGMPSGSPGMEGGRPEVYEVVLFGKDGRRTYGRYLGATPA